MDVFTSLYSKFDPGSTKAPLNLPHIVCEASNCITIMIYETIALKVFNVLHVYIWAYLELLYASDH